MAIETACANCKHAGFTDLGAKPTYQQSIRAVCNHPSCIDERVGVNYFLGEGQQLSVLDIHLCNDVRADTDKCGPTATLFEPKDGN